MLDQLGKMIAVLGWMLESFSSMHYQPTSAILPLLLQLKIWTKQQKKVAAQHLVIGKIVIWIKTFRYTN